MKDKLKLWVKLNGIKFPCIDCKFTEVDKTEHILCVCENDGKQAHNCKHFAVLPNEVYIKMGNILTHAFVQESNEDLYEKR